MNKKTAQKKPIRGEIWSVNLDPTLGCEQAKTRPCLVISANRLNKSGAELVTIIPLTSKRKDIPWWVEVKSTVSNKLKSTSYIMCEQVRTVSKVHLGFAGEFGIIEYHVLEQVNERLRYLLVL